jgi:hypothetical protein
MLNPCVVVRADELDTTSCHEVRRLAATALHGHFAATDRQSDQLVHQLYGLTDAEIALVEGSPISP